MRLTQLRATIVMLAACVGALIVPTTVAASVEIRFVSPAPSSPIFDQVIVEIGVSVEDSRPTFEGLPDESIEQGAIPSVELLVDERSVGRLDSPPYRFTVDVGAENREHRLEAVVHGPDGVMGRRVLVTPKVEIHDQVQLDLQQVYATVTDSGGRRVLDLAASDFTLIDNGVKEEIVTFASRDVPFTAILLVDTSLSMAGKKLKAALRGAQAFVAGMQQYDEAKLMLFSDRLVATGDFTNDPAKLVDDLDAVRATGGTALNDFLFLALRELDQRQGRRVVIVLSDGFDVHSVLNMDRVRSAAQRSRAQIFEVRLVEGNDDRGIYSSWRTPRESKAERKLLDKTVTESGGRRLEIESEDLIEASFEEILLELRQQYAIGFYPDDLKSDGRRRKIDLLVERRGLEVRMREGYLDL